MEDYELLRYPKSRVATFDVGRIGGRKHHVAGLVEADVTEARERISRGMKEGRDVGFTAWTIKVIGSTIAEHPNVHAINQGIGKQVAFKDVDISVPIERTIDGVKVPLVAVIRKTNEKTIEDIHRELQGLKRKEIRSEKDYVLEERGGGFANKLFFSLPQFARLAIWKLLLKDPFTVKKNMGTAIVTNVGTAGNISGWIIPKSIHNLCFGIGSLNKRPWIKEGKIEIREILHLTVLFDHDVVDGAPAARFVARLIGNMEKARGLE